MTRIDEIRDRLDKATPGPWMPDIDDWPTLGAEPMEDCLCTFHGDECEFWEMTQEGTDEDGHHWHHHRLTNWHHLISPTGEVTGNYDYEAGGILKRPDAEFIAHAREDIPYLLGVVERLEGLLMDAGITYTGPSADAAFQAAQRVSPGRLDPEWFAAGKHQHGASPITKKEN